MSSVGTYILFQDSTCPFLQAFRRFQWVPVRVEVELRKLQQQKPELGQLVPAPSLDKLAKGSDRKGLLHDENP